MSKSTLITTAGVGGQPNGVPVLDGNSGLLVPAYAELAGIAAPAAPAAGKSRLYLDANGLLQLVPAAGGSTRRMATDWGSGTILPSGAGVQRGDVYAHTGLGCLLVYGPNGWRQEDIPSFATAVARTNMSGTYSAALYTGFRVRQTDTGNTWEWTGSAWKAVPDYTFPTASAHQAGATTGAPAGWHTLALDTVDIDSHSAFTTGTTYDVTTSSKFTVPAGQDGLYACEGSAFLLVPATVFYNARIIKNNATVVASQGSSSYNATGTATALSAGTGRHLLNLVAGDSIQLQGYTSGNSLSTGGSTTYPDGGSWLAVERIR